MQTGDTMRKVAHGDHVIVEYEARLEDGEIVDSSTDNGPLEFEVGAGIIAPGFENALLGMQEGEVKAIALPPDETFGHKDENLLHQVRKSVFGEKIEPQPGMILGMTVEKDGRTQKIPALITAVNGEDVTIDFNHPLAGRTIHYTLTLKSIKN